MIYHSIIGDLKKMEIKIRYIEVENYGYPVPGDIMGAAQSRLSGIPDNVKSARYAATI